ncbi:hypothetical protein ACS0TY_021383 [Phlomoides rotata]
MSPSAYPNLYSITLSTMSPSDSTALPHRALFNPNTLVPVATVFSHFFKQLLLPIQSLTLIPHHHIEPQTTPDSPILLSLKPSPTVIASLLSGFAGVSGSVSEKLVGQEPSGQTVRRWWKCEARLDGVSSSSPDGASGQVINLDKSDIVFSGGIHLSRAEALASRLGVRRVDEHVVYLGIPTNLGRSKCDIFRCLVNRVAKKVKDLNNKTLSQVGKLTLVKSVVQSVPTYLMSCFRIPSTIIDQMKSIIARFLLGILDGRLVLLRGLHWTVGNGSQIRIWDDHCLLMGGGGLVSLDRVERGEVQVVSDLIDHTRRSWDLTRARALFPEDVIARILAISVGESELSDELIWRFNKDGIYSTRSGYGDGTGLEMGVVSGEQIRWSLVWDLHVPNKVKHFPWKVVHGILPTSINLVLSFVDVDPIYQRCGHETETAEHLFRECVWVKDFWESSVADFVKFLSMDSGRSCAEWVLASLAAIPGVKQRALFSVQLWNVWFSRNQLIFERKHFSHAQILDSSLCLVSEFWDANPRGGVSHKRRLLKGWEPPAQGRVKLNTDASVRTGWGTGVAGLLRDSTGLVVWCFTESYPFELSIDLAEPTTMLRGLQIASDRGVADIVVEADSLTLVTAISKCQPDLSYFGRIVRHIVELSESFGSVSFSWTCRTGNRAAHVLASFAFLYSDNFFDVSVPETLVPVVNSDLLAA